MPDTVPKPARRLSPGIDYDETEPVEFVPFGEFANRVQVTEGWLSKAANQDRLCRGMPVAEWRVVDRQGRTRGFDVPISVYEALDHIAERQMSA